MKVSFNRFAERELIAAARYLQSEASLGREFLDEYEAWEARVRRFPKSCPEIAPGIHCGYLARFKYHSPTPSGAIACGFCIFAPPDRSR